MNNTRRIAVKPLEWVENSDRKYWYTARALGVKYDVQEIGLGEWWLSIDEDRIMEPFAYCEDAKDAAHADYERHILSTFIVVEHIEKG